VLIARALPWSLGLMLTALLISWTLGNLIGLLAGYHNKSNGPKAIETAAMMMYPIPYYILACCWSSSLPISGRSSPLSSRSAASPAPLAVHDQRRL
jgi:ABC-type dipeptide/oligopeptide/nickel transport system permease component